MNASAVEEETIDQTISRTMNWFDFTQFLEGKGYTYAGSENDHGFKRPSSNDWKCHHYGRSCITISVSDSLKMYTVLDSGD